MEVLVKKGTLILSEKGHRSSEGYRKIVELMARFGHVSMQEVMYGEGLSFRAAVRRMQYLGKAGFIMRFPSLTVPKSFYCLTREGREAVRQFMISDEVSPFIPSRYQWASQEHHRSIIKVYLALRKIFGSRFLGWASEGTLKAEEEARQKLTGGTEKRILDGECFLEITRTRYKENAESGLVVIGEPSREQWRCGVEVELSLKSPERYRKQFRDLASRVYDGFSKDQRYSMIIFFSGSQMVQDRLAKHLRSGQYNVGDCVFYLARIDEFLERLGQAPMERFAGGESIRMAASQMSAVEVIE